MKKRFLAAALAVLLLSGCSDGGADSGAGVSTTPVPPLSEQCRIVAILDRFDALCSDLTSGLPAEIAARKKQYEYYRDKLLTFKEHTNVLL